MNALPRPTRPWGVSVVLGVVLALGLWNSGRAIILARQLDRLGELATEPSPVWRLSVALGWILLCGAVAVGMMRPSPWARWAALGLMVAYALVDVGLQVTYATPPPPLQLLLYATLILFTALALGRPQAKRYFDPSIRQEVAEHRIP